MAGAFILYAGVAPSEHREKVLYGPYEHEMYHDGSLAPSELSEVGQALADFGYFPHGPRQSILITSDGSSFVLHILVDKGWWDELDVLESLATLKENMKRYAISRPVRIWMRCQEFLSCDEKEI